MVHKPKHKVHSFRGLLGDGGQDEINLERSNLNLAYRIVKFEIIGNAVGAVTYESVVQIFREKQDMTTAVADTIDFDNADLLAAAYFTGRTDYTSSSSTIAFENTIFSRNIYVTHSELSGSASCNYYIELEEVAVSPSTLMQLKLGVARKLSLSQSPPDA